MKIPCRVYGYHATVVGYSQGRKNKPLAIVITQGKLIAVRLKDIELTALSRPEAGNVSEFPHAS